MEPSSLSGSSSKVSFLAPNLPLSFEEIGKFCTELVDKGGGLKTDFAPSDRDKSFQKSLKLFRN